MIAHLLLAALATSARQIAHKVLLRTFKSDAFADRALNSEFAKADSLADGERRQATEIVYGVLRTGHSLDYQLAQLTSSSFAKKTPMPTLCALRMGAYELLHLSTPGYAAINEAVDLCGSQKSQRSFANGVLRNLLRKRDDESLPTLSDDESLTRTQRLAIETSTPNWLLSDLSTGDGAPLASFNDLEAWAHASQERPPITLRINRKRTTRDRVAEELTAHGLSVEPVDGLADALLLEAGGGAVTSLPGFADGLWSVQDVGAQCVALLAAPALSDNGEPRRVLDLCAAPGGKSTHLAELVGDGGVLSVEVHARKARLIEQSCARLGHAEAVDVQVADATDSTALQGLLESKGWSDGVDAVVVDAPCSGLGTLRRNPEHRYRKADPKAMDALSKLQASLLAAAATCVRPGGTLIYSVCSPRYEETDAAVERFLKEQPSFELLPAPPELAPFAAENGAAVRTWTHLHPADSHFAVRLRRGG